MKKILSVLTIFLMLVSLCTFANAYSTSQYSIDIPSTWKQNAANSFMGSGKNSANIQITKSTYGMGNPYTQDNLNKLVNELHNNVDAYKNDMVNSLKQTYGTYMSEQKIREYVSTFKCNSVDVSEITTCTKNNYKCFHIIANYEMADYSYYCNQYSIISGNYVFTLTVSASDKTDFDKEEMKGIVDSFTINNYQAPSELPFSPIVMGALIGAAVGAVIGVVNYFRNKKKKETENSNN